MMMHMKYTLIGIISASLIAGCTGYAPTPFAPLPVDTSAYVAKVDAFVVVLDTSDSMNSVYANRFNFYTAKDVVYNINQTIPELGYTAALVGFGGSIVNPNDVRVAYGPATYRRADFARGLSSLEDAGGLTPMAEGIDAGGETLKGASGKVALILVSDFWHVNAGDVNAVVDKLKAEYGDRLCIHTIKVGNSPDGDDLIAALAGVNSCGSSVNAASLASSDAVTSFVTAALLQPVAGSAAAIKYEKNTVSAYALFDSGKAVLKEGGKTTLRALDQSIKAKGASVVDVRVVGHTDNQGPEQYNMGLSMLRAEAVKEYMISDGISPSIIRISGEGETKPIASNATAEGRAQNRRVDVYVGTRGM